MDNGLRLWSDKRLREHGDWQYEGVCVELHLFVSSRYTLLMLLDPKFFVIYMHCGSL